jgi:hypothetical protein
LSSYQVPQFLDSGDKILGPLNLRQFAYVLITFFICMIIFTFTSSLFPTAGFYAIIPAVPVALFGAFLSLGKYNGRDSEVYIVKWLTSFAKPKKMIYNRQPYLDDLNKRAVEWSAPKIQERWTKSISQIQEDDKDVYSDFRQIQSEKKADMIKDLGGGIDDGFYNTLSEVKRRELLIDSKEEMIKMSLKQQQYFKKYKNQKNQMPYMPTAMQPTYNFNSNNSLQNTAKVKVDNFFKAGE